MDIDTATGGLGVKMSKSTTSTSSLQHFLLHTYKTSV